MAIVVSDTSPIRALRHLGLLDLLRALYDEVFIPPAVLAELRVIDSDTPAEQIIPSWLRIQAPTNIPEVRRLLNSLDAGESEAIALAIELHADFLLIDEKDGRAEATRCGLESVGALGVLLQAKKNGMIPAIGPLINSLRTDLKFYVSDKLHRD